MRMRNEWTARFGIPIKHIVRAEIEALEIPAAGVRVNRGIPREFVTKEIQEHSSTFSVITRITEPVIPQRGSVARFVGIGKFTQPLADAVQNAVVRRIPDIQGHKVLLVKFRVAQDFLKELPLGFLGAGARHDVSVRVILRCAQDIFKELLSCFRAKLRVNGGVFHVKFRLDFKWQ
jgi:hypothetical protein